MQKNNLLDIVKKKFRENKKLIDNVLKKINLYSTKLEKRGYEKIKIMNFCGTHEWSITHYGIRNVLPENIELIAGPGCPVCIVPSVYIDILSDLAEKNIKIYTFGDAYKLMSIRKKKMKSIEEIKASGFDVEIVYSFLDAIKKSKKEKVESVFLGIGFETMAPIYAICFAKNIIAENLKFLSCVRLTPPAMRYVIKLYKERGILPISGVIAPGHVSTIIGAEPWSFLSDEYSMPVSISGFEPLDILLSITAILRMLLKENPRVFLEYTRAVSHKGNEYAKNVIESVFEPVYSAWRGMGMIPRSGLKLKDKYKKWDVINFYEFNDIEPESFILTNVKGKDDTDIPHGCRCSEVVVGLSKPTDCRLFMNKCTPTNPYGPCMVSIEGTCNIWARCKNVLGCYWKDS